VHENTILLFALIGLRALAEYDPAEYARASDTSKRELDNRIQHLFELIGNLEVDNSLLVELASKQSQLNTITYETRGHSAAVFLLKQLHLSCLERAQQLSLLYAPEPRRREVARTSILAERSILSRRSPDERSHQEEFLRLATMRLLRELPGYSASFEVLTPKSQIDCVLFPPALDLPTIIVESKTLLGTGDVERVIKFLRRALSAWGKGTLGVVICAAVDPELWDRPIQKDRIFVLEFDIESNEFRGEGAGRLSRIVWNQIDSSGS
jgi:hypothetical protein